MIIIEGRGPITGYKPSTTRVEVDAGTHQGAIEFSVAADIDGLWAPFMNDLSGHPFVRSTCGHQYIRILRKSLVTFRLPAGCNYWFTKGDFFRLVKEGTNRYYAIEFDEKVDKLREFTLHAHSTYVRQDAYTEAQLHSFNIGLSGPGVSGRAAAEIDPDIKNPPPVGG